MKIITGLFFAFLTGISASIYAEGGFFFYQTPKPDPAPSAPVFPLSDNLTVIAPQGLAAIAGQNEPGAENRMKDYPFARLEAAIKVGDMVLRKGLSWESRLIRRIDNTDYSHIAYVSQIHPEVWVVHAATDDNPAKPNQVIKERLTSFLDNRKAQGFAVYRPDFISFSDRELIASELEHSVGKPFVLASREQPHRYCSTLIYYAVNKRYSAYQPAWKNISYRQYRGVFLMPSAMVRGMRLIAEY